MSEASSFPCGTCKVTLESRDEYRDHAQSDWHVYNIKRRLASLEPIDSSTYEHQILAQKQPGSSFRSSTTRAEHETPISDSLPIEDADAMQSNSEDEKDEETKEGESRGHDENSEAVDVDVIQKIQQKFIPSQCLFCNLDSSTFELNFEHMCKAHGLFIPDQEHVVDLETLVGYMFTVISEFTECIYCGTMRSTKEAVQQHMLGKGHCNIRIDEDSEFTEFYDYPENPEDADTARPIHKVNLPVQDNELRLPSGKTLSHRSNPRRRSPPPRSSQSSPQLALTDGSPNTSSTEPTDHSSSSSSRQERTKQLVLRQRASDAQALIGLSLPQQRVLMATEKRLKKQEIRLRNQHRAVVEKAANRQKFFVPDAPARSNG